MIVGFLKRIRSFFTAELKDKLVDLQHQVAHLEYNLFDIKREIVASKIAALDIKYSLKTDNPVAIFSNDHINPRGTSKDDTRYPRFVTKCNAIFKRKLCVLDIGCSGGGLVYDFIMDGHNALGLEGSDYSFNNQRAHWKILPQNLFTCDVTKPFAIYANDNNVNATFDVISAWEFLEHISEEDIQQLLKNISAHLADDGIFCASVATFEDVDPVTGQAWHVTVKPKQWWVDILGQNGLTFVDKGFVTKDFPRGSGNPLADDWDAALNPELGFHLVAMKNKA